MTGGDRHGRIDEQLGAQVQGGGPVERGFDVALLAVGHNVPVGARIADLSTCDMLPECGSRADQGGWKT